MKPLITSLKSRLQFVIVIVMFFPVMLDALYGVTNTDNATSSQLLLGYSVLVFAVLASYILLETMGEKIAMMHAKIINRLLLCEVGLFALVFYFLASSTSDAVTSTTGWMLCVYSVAFGGALLLPVFILLSLATNYVWNLFTQTK